MAKRTIKYEPRDFDMTLDEAAACKQYAIWAEDAWGEYLGTAPDVGISADYEQGFHEGFVDYVFAGGSGEPPPVPPRRFWRTMYRNPEGDQTIADWTAGFRAGASAAKQGGYRKRALVPAVRSRASAEEQPLYGDSVLPMPPSPNDYEIIEDPSVDSYPPISKSDSYITSPSEGEAIGEGSISQEPIGEGLIVDEGELESDARIVTPEEMSPENGDLPSGASPSDASDILDLDVGSPTAEDAKTNPFIDDPEDTGPLDELPGVGPSNSPQDEFLPDENLYEELFGEPDGMEQEAYRRDAIPSDRVIQNAGESASELVDSEPSLAGVVQTDFTANVESLVTPPVEASLGLERNDQSPSTRINPFEIEPVDISPLAETGVAGQSLDARAHVEVMPQAKKPSPEPAPPVQTTPVQTTPAPTAVETTPVQSTPAVAAPNPFVVDPMESDPFDEIIAPAKDATKKGEPVEPIQAKKPKDQEKRSQASRAPLGRATSRTTASYGDAIVASQSNATSRVYTNASDTPVRREDWFISGLNDRKKKRTNNSLRPDSLAPTAVDRIADQLVGSPMPAVPPSGPSQAASELPQIVVPPPQVAVPETQVLASQPVVPSVAEEVVPADQSPNPIALTSLNEPVPTAKGGGESDLVVQQNAANEVEPVATLRIQPAIATDTPLAKNPATAAAETKQAQPIALSKLSPQQTAPVEPTLSKTKSELVFKSSGSRKNKVNATRELIRARQAFRGPEGLRTNQDIYSGLFQQK